MCLIVVFARWLLIKPDLPCLTLCSRQWQVLRQGSIPGAAVPTTSYTDLVMYSHYCQHPAVFSQGGNLN